MEVRSRKVPMGRVLRPTSRKRRSTAFAVRTCLRPSDAGYRKRVGKSSGSSHRHSTAFGWESRRRSAKRRAAAGFGAFTMLWRWRSASSWSGLRSLLGMFPILWARQCRTGMSGRTGAGRREGRRRRRRGSFRGLRRWGRAGGGRRQGSHSAELSPRAGRGATIPLRASGRTCQLQKKSRTIRAFPLQNMGFSDRSGVRLMFTAGEDKPHA